MLREGDAGLRARLFDFGIVPFADPIEADPGSARGVACMAPEQFQGEPADRRTDIFALGLLCFELLTALPDATSSERYRGRGDVPEAVWRALQTALTTERDGRYASVEAMLEALTPAWDQPLERVAHAAPAGDGPVAAAPAGDAPPTPARGGGAVVRLRALGRRPARAALPVHRRRHRPRAALDDHRAGADPRRRWPRRGRRTSSPSSPRRAP